MSLLKSSGGSATGLLGKQTAPKDLGYDAKIILVPDSTEIATKTLGLTESTWLDAINAAVGTRYIVLPIFYELEPTPEEDVTAASSLGSVAFVREGKDTVAYNVITTPFVMSQMRTLNGVEWKAYIITSTGVIKGTTTDLVKLLPFSIGYFRVGKEVKASGSTPATVPTTITYSDASEWSSRPAFVEPLREGVSANWNPRDLKDPKAITSVITNFAITGFDIYLEGYDEVPFEGATLNDVLLRNASTLVGITLDSLTESTPGQYAALATIPASATYDVGMAPVGTASATQGYAGLVADLQTEILA